jgi:DNA-binding transcriptional regulator PaaX
MAAERRTWLLLVYTIPREPSASRVYVWRKLKRLGALMMQDAVWVLPATSATREQFQWLATEIKELKGAATLWKSRLILGAPEEDLVRRFEAETESAYGKILVALKRPVPDVAALSRHYQQLQSLDYFQSALGKKVRTALLAHRGRRP